jgi:Glu-tRNA(Gln) amidotransferase subunit E-like FAD-binding protein
MERLGEAAWIQVFDLFTGGKVPREAIQPIAAHLAQNRGIDAVTAAADLGYQLRDREAWTAELGGILSQDCPIDKGMQSDCAARNMRHTIGQCVHKLRGRAAAKEVAEYLKSRLAQEVSQ